MSDKFTPKQFAAKIEWEGGVVSALEYGLAAEDLADTEDAAPLKAAWANLEQIWDNFSPAMDKVDVLLEKINSQ